MKCQIIYICPKKVFYPHIMELYYKLIKIWKSNLPRPSKIKLFQAPVESILLYGSETWTVTTKI